MPDSGQVIVSMSGLVKRYPGVLALAGADLDLRRGEILGLVGKNGAGKSTVIKVLAGVEKPDGGELLIDGAPPPAHYASHIAHQMGLAFVHQEIGNFPGLTVAENIALGARYPRRLGLFIAKRRLRDGVSEVLRRLHTDIDPGADVAELTTVQQRVVMIGRALYHRARLLVLDEPSTALTGREIDQLHSIARQLRDDGASILYVSHRLEEILSLTDRVAVMRDGRVILERPTRQLSHRELVEAIAGEAPAGAVTERPWARADERATASTPLLRVRHLARPPAVKDVSFDLYPGEILGLAGLIGSGRTELARLLSGADRSTGGIVDVAGHALRLKSPADAIRAGIALLPEDRRYEGLVLDFGVRENVTLASLSEHRRGRLPLTSRRREAAATEEMVSRLTIQTPTVEQQVRRLSGGNQQKVVVAKWLVRHGQLKVLIFDEPTQGVDVGAKEEIFRLIRRIADRDRGTAAIVISSEFEELTRLCTRVIALREGAVAGTAEGNDITEQMLVSLVYGEGAGTTVEGVDRVDAQS